MAYFLSQVSTTAPHVYPKTRQGPLGGKGAQEHSVENSCFSSVHSGPWILCVQKQSFLGNNFWRKLCLFFPSLSWFHKKKKENLNLDLGLSLGRTWVQDTSRHGFKSWLHYFLAVWAL